MDFEGKRQLFIRWLKDTDRIPPCCNETDEKVSEFFGPQPTGRPRSNARKNPGEVVAFFIERHRETGSTKVAVSATAKHFEIDDRTIWRILKESRNLLWLLVAGLIAALFLGV